MRREALAAAGLLGILLAAWELVVRSTGVSALVLPAPSSVLGVIIEGLFDGFLWPHVAATAAATVSGFLLGGAVGFGTGLLLAEYPAARRLVWPYLLASQVVPKLALGPLLVVWLGFGLQSTIVITALVCFFPLLENTLTGMQAASAEQRDLFRSLRASRWQTVRRLKLPAGLPTILSGARVAIVLALVGAVVGEFIGGQIGLGATIIAAQGMMDTPLMFAVFVVLTGLGLLLYQCVVLLERWLLRGRSRAG